MEKLWHNKQWLEEQYTHNKKSMQKIAMICGCSNENIWYWIKKFEIPINSYSAWNKDTIGVMKPNQTSFKKGQKAHNKGVRPTDETIEKQRQKVLGRHLSPRTEFQKGNIPWNVGTKGKGIMKPNKTSFKKGDVSHWKGKKLTKEHVKKVLTRRIPSSLEEKFQGIIDKHSLPYKFVGDGSFFVEQYNPDFVNIDGEKIAVEVYARYYKLRNHQDIDKWKEERANIFKKYGWTMVYFDETQVNETYILSTLGGN